MLKVKKLIPEAILPTVAHPWEDVAYDLYTPFDVTIPAGETKIIKTGIAIDGGTVFTGERAAEGRTGFFGGLMMPVGFKLAFIFKDRSGVSAKTKLFTRGGVIDAGYRGELGVIMHNLSNLVDYSFKAGDRICQMVPILTLTEDVLEVEELEETTRGAKGFGSSGK